MRTQFYEQKVHCIICTNPIPPERLRFKSITCSDKCKRERKRMMYVQMESTKCVFCKKPTTRAEQQLWNKFRKFAAANLEIFFAPQMERWRPNETEREFTFDIAMQMLDRELHEKKLAEIKSGKIGRGPKGGNKDGGAGVSPHTEMGSAEGEEGAEMQDPESSESEHTTSSN